jgi:hypothetical protein
MRFLGKLGSEYERKSKCSEVEVLHGPWLDGIYLHNCAVSGKFFRFLGIQGRKVEI